MDKVDEDLSVKQDYVTFYPPGTFVAEESRQPIPSWDVEEAQRRAADIVERYNATPYAFRFSTRGRREDELDSRTVATSPMYYINCKVMTLEELKAKNDKSEETLISNMECNGWDRIVRTTLGWRWSAPLESGDVVLEVKS